MVAVEGAAVTTMALANLAESPLAQLVRRKARDGKPFLDDREFQAGERLRADYTRGRIMPRLGANWVANVASGKRAGNGGLVDLTDAALAARQRVDKAIVAVGPELAGVLVETTRNPGGRETGYTVVIGMGVNLVDAGALSQALGRQVADWACVTEHAPGHAATAADLVCAAATAWHEAVRTLEREGFAAFSRRFDQVDALAGRPVNVLDKGDVVLSGTACGVDGQGRLLVQTPQGAMPISVGEISIRRQA